MSSPYRDEIESLRAENARLRASLAARRKGSAGLAACFCLLDVAAILALRPWLNGPDEGRFWAALGIIALFALFAVGGALGYKRS